MIRRSLPLALVAAAFACGTRQPPAPPTRSPCVHYFEATASTRCGGVALPIDAHVAKRARYETACSRQFDFPGNGVTNEWLEACASALDAAPCSLRGVPDACLGPPGSLPGGTACFVDSQCRSGVCEGAAPNGPPPNPSPSCGLRTCDPPLEIGETCGSTTYPARCIWPGAACNAGANPSGACVAVTRGDLGAPCAAPATYWCTAGLWCDSANAGTCMPRAGVHGACTTDNECEGRLQCGSDRACHGPQPLGAPCFKDGECIDGLACIRNTCASMTWARPSESCGDHRPCIVGQCRSADQVCPVIVPDGQLCDVASPDTTCDSYAECTDGTCQFPYPASCR